MTAIQHVQMMRPAHRLSGPVLCAAALVLASCATVSPPPLERPDTTGSVNFPEIERFTRLYMVMRYEGDAAIRRAVSPQYDELALVDLPATRNRYMIGTSRTAKRQEIWIRGTANLRNAGFDLDYGLRYNAELGIELHKGFEEITRTLYARIRPRLDPDYDLVIFGHSLGAAEAIILAMLLWKEGYRVRQVYASGCPRVTTRSGAEKYAFLPVLRIVNPGDPVPFLPPRDIVSASDPYTQLGTVLFLLDGPYYCLLKGEESEAALALTLQPQVHDRPLNRQIAMHLTPAYLGRLQTKVHVALQVLFSDWLLYLPSPPPESPLPPFDRRGSPR
ncbi:MAG TPA: lipase family protein [Spirochaetia bacterium]